ncbi:rna recognition motif [Stylonychia lemnae]|uniref:Rna recognition motif n=1 Tax=Stylonychia lemnae TaxID=5949 RepID=A0A078A8F5_STYLE|nr:rna recognition motif [Stylonychia lemnae]|eukprot:CDW78151.1 rna recognition motif [Stylonychia lemnae]
MLEGHDYMITAICLIQETNQLLSADEMSNVKSWDLNSNRCIQTFTFQLIEEGNNQFSQKQIDMDENLEIVDVFYNQQNKMLVLSTKLIDGDTGQTTKLYQNISQIQTSICCMVLDKTLKHFITADIYGRIETYGVINGKKSYSLVSHKAEITYIAITDDISLNWLMSYSQAENLFMVQSLDKHGNIVRLLKNPIGFSNNPKEDEVIGIDHYNNHVAFFTQKRVIIWDIQSMKFETYINVIENEFIVKGKFSTTLAKIIILSLDNGKVHFYKMSSGIQPCLILSIISLKILQYATQITLDDQMMYLGLNSGEIQQYQSQVKIWKRRPSLLKTLSNATNMKLQNEYDKFQEKNGAYIIPQGVYVNNQVPITLQKIVTIKEQNFILVSTMKPIFKIYVAADLQPIINISLKLPYPIQWDLHIGTDNKRIQNIKNAIDNLSKKELDVLIERFQSQQEGDYKNPIILQGAFRRFIQHNIYEQMQKRTNIKKLQNLNDEQIKQEKIVEIYERDEIIRKLQEQYSSVFATPKSLETYQEIREKYEQGNIDRQVFEKIPTLLYGNVDILDIDRESDEKIERYMSFVRNFDKKSKESEKIKDFVKKSPNFNWKNRKQLRGKVKRRNSRYRTKRQRLIQIEQEGELDQILQFEKQTRQQNAQRKHIQESKEHLQFIDTLKNIKFTLAQSKRNNIKESQKENSKEKCKDTSIKEQDELQIMDTQKSTTMQSDDKQSRMFQPPKLCKKPVKRFSGQLANEGSIEIFDTFSMKQYDFPTESTSLHINIPILRQITRESLNTPQSQPFMNKRLSSKLKIEENLQPQKPGTAFASSSQLSVKNKNQDRFLKKKVFNFEDLATLIKRDQGTMSSMQQVSPSIIQPSIQNIGQSPSVITSGCGFYSQRGPRGQDRQNLTGSLLQPPRTTQGIVNETTSRILGRNLTTAETTISEWSYGNKGAYTNIVGESLASARIRNGIFKNKI